MSGAMKVGKYSGSLTELAAAIGPSIAVHSAMKQVGIERYKFGFNDIEGELCRPQGYDYTIVRAFGPDEQLSSFMGKVEAAIQSKLVDFSDFYLELITELREKQRTDQLLRAKRARYTDKS